MNGPGPAGPARSDAPAPQAPRALNQVVATYTDRFGLVCTLTLVSFLALPPRGTLPVALVVGAGGLLALHWVGTDWRFWGVLTVTATVGSLSHPWLDLDNHHVLELYWLAAVAIACLAADRRRTLALTARLLVGGAFAFAVLWKVLSPDFLDGTFLTYLVTSDANVAQAAGAIGLQDPQVIVDNRSAIEAVVLDPTNEPSPVQLKIGSAAARFADVLTAVTMVMELAVAISFLAPLRARWRWIRDATLVAFVLTTYPAAPVVGFGWVLTTLGLAQSELRGRRAEVLYLGVFVILGSLLIGNPLVDLVGRLTG